MLPVINFQIMTRMDEHKALLWQLQKHSIENESSSSKINLLGAVNS